MIRSIAELKAKVRLEIWRHELHDCRGSRTGQRLSKTISADWFRNWPQFPPHIPKVKA